MKQVKEDSLIAEAYSLVAEHNNPEALQYKGFIYNPAMEHTGDRLDICIFSGKSEIRVVLCSII